MCGPVAVTLGWTYAHIGLQLLLLACMYLYIQLDLHTGGWLCFPSTCGFLWFCRVIFAILGECMHVH